MARHVLRPRVTREAGTSQTLRRPAALGDARETGEWRELSNDETVLAPAAAASDGRIGQRRRRSARDGDFPELVEREVSDPLAVWRKERVIGAVGTGQQRRLRIAEEPRRRKQPAFPRSLRWRA